MYILTIYYIYFFTTGLTKSGDVPGICKIFKLCPSLDTTRMYFGESGAAFHASATPFTIESRFPSYFKLVKSLCTEDPLDLKMFIICIWFGILFSSVKATFSASESGRVFVRSLRRIFEFFISLKNVSYPFIFFCGYVTLLCHLGKSSPELFQRFTISLIYLPVSCLRVYVFQILRSSPSSKLPVNFPRTLSKKFGGFLLWEILAENLFP